MTRRQARARWWTRLTRDSVLFAVGLVSFVYEVLHGGGRPAVLAACVTLMGLPVGLRVDERQRRRDRDDR